MDGNYAGNVGYSELRRTNTHTKKVEWNCWWWTSSRFHFISLHVFLVWFFKEKKIINNIYISSCCWFCWLVRHGGTSSVGFIRVPRHEYSFNGRDRIVDGRQQEKKRTNELYGNQRFKKRHFVSVFFFNIKKKTKREILKEQEEKNKEEISNRWALRTAGPFFCLSFKVFSHVHECCLFSLWCRPPSPREKRSHFISVLKVNINEPWEVVFVLTPNHLPFIPLSCWKKKREKKNHPFSFYDIHTHCVLFSAGRGTN